VTTGEIIRLKLLPALAECERHRDRLRYAAARSAAVFPLTPERYQALTDAEGAFLDQMLFRFGKLQDAMGQRLLPAILRAGQEWRDDETFLDKLNRLEKLGAIPSADAWIKLRDLRNGAMHEYPDAPEINAASLNLLHEAIGTLETHLDRASDYAREHFRIA
jgi:hypothetical protein